MGDPGSLSPGAAAELLAERAEDLYEDAPAGYIITLPDGTIVRANRTFLTWTGYGHDDVVGQRRFVDLLTVAGRIFHETHYAPLLAMQGFVNEVALDLVRSDGRRLPVLINTSQKRGVDGRPMFNRTTIFEATDRRAYERELLLARRQAEETAKARADLLAMIGHDIRSPLGAIVSAVALLERTPCSPAQARYLGLLRSASSHLAHMTDSLLMLSRMEAGAAALEEAPFDLRDLVDTVVNGVQLAADAKQLSVQAQVDDAVPATVVGDRLKLAQVLGNLVGNAVKFTEHGTVGIAVRAAERDGDGVHLVFQVWDTGIGIAQDRQAAIFEEFAQASPDIASTYGGTGLGLAIARKLLHLYGSTIAVESTPGKGSAFSFALRLKTA